MLLYRHEEKTSLEVLCIIFKNSADVKNKRLIVGKIFMRESGQWRDQAEKILKVSCFEKE